MDLKTLKKAFAILATRLKAELAEDIPVTIYLIGSAAALLRGDLDRDAKDCDMVSYDPVTIQTEIENAVGDVSSELGLESEWLNNQAYFFADYLPSGWKDRTETVFNDDNLTVRAPSRSDILVTKAMGMLRTGEDKHRADLIAMHPTADEVALTIDVIKNIGYRCNEVFDQLVEELMRLQENLGAEPE